MANRMENQVGLLKETTYGTPVTPSRFYPYLDGTDGQYDTRQRQGQSIFVSSKRGWRGDRRVLPKGIGVITIKTELASRQGGALFELATGVATSTLISGTTYYQKFLTSVPGTVLPSATIQLGKVRNDGTVDPETYAGCTAVSWEIECPEDGILMISVVFDALSMTTATGLASASYTSGAFLYDSSQGSITVGGSVTQPTGTSLATGGTAFNNLQSWKLAVNQQADIGRWVVAPNGRNQPTVGTLAPEFTADAEYNDLTLRTAYLAGTGVPVVITHTTTEVLSTGFSQFQLSIPQVFLKSPVLPPMNDETSVVKIAGDVTFDGTNELFYLLFRTADSAL